MEATAKPVCEKLPGLCLDAGEGQWLSSVTSSSPFCETLSLRGCTARKQVLWVVGSEELPSALMAQLDSKNSAQCPFLTGNNGNKRDSQLD